MSRRIKWLVFLMLSPVAGLGVIYGSLAWSGGEPAPDQAFFQQEQPHPLVIAHRGGAGQYPENTLFAFRQSLDLGVDVIELDVRATADGTLVVMHDATVDRTTDGSGPISEMTLEAVKKLDAGYRWSADGGKTFPHRAGGLTVPTLKEVFAAFPAAKFNIEPKQETPSLVKPLCGLIREHKLIDRVVVGSFKQTVLDDFRRECTEIATSAGPSEVSKFLAMYKTGLGASYSPAMQALQVPEYIGGVQVLSKEFVETAHRLNLKVHVWTVNETADMRRLLEMGVDGIMTDYPDRLLSLLGRTPKDGKGKIK